MNFDIYVSRQVVLGVWKAPALCQNKTSGLLVVWDKLATKYHGQELSKVSIRRVPHSHTGGSHSVYKI